MKTQDPRGDKSLHSLSNSDQRNSPKSNSGSVAPAETKANAELGRGDNKPDRDQIEIIRPMWTSKNVLTLEAWDHSLKRAVMVRKLTPEAAANQATSEEFWRQARNQARLRHNRILPILFMDKLSGWVVTEFCEKRLVDEIQSAGISADRGLRILTHALEGLVYLEERGQIHGGIHPGVVLIEPNDSVKLDHPSGREAGGELILQRGFEKYAVPESLDESRFGAVGCAADVYALGITVLELLAGKKFVEFFRGYDLDFENNGDAWLRWNLSADAKAPSVNSILPKIPATLASVIDGMLEKHVMKRLSASAALAVLSGNAPRISQTSPLVESTKRELTIANSSVRTIEPIALASHARVADVFITGPANSDNAGLKGWAERLMSEGNSTYLAAAMILVAAFVAGLSLIGGSSVRQTDPMITLTPENNGLNEADAGSYAGSVADEGAAAQKPADPAPRIITAPPPTVVQSGGGETKTAKKESKPKGQLLVSVSPSGAWVKVNGVSSSPGSAISLAEGTYVVQVGKWDCLPQEQDVVVQSGNSKRITIELKQRPATTAYEPVLSVPRDKAGEADRLVSELLNESWIGDGHVFSMVRIERQLSEAKDLSSDPRVLHALAVVALGPKNNARRAQTWYERAATSSPVCYSWPYKGLVKCLMAQGNTSEALRCCDDFTARARQLVAKSPNNPKAQLFLEDTACFVGRVVGLAEASSTKSIDRLLIGRELESQLPPPAADAFTNAKSETLARYEETVAVGKTDKGELVWRFLGDSVAQERRMLLDSIGIHSQSGVRVQVAAPQASITVRYATRQDTGLFPATSKELLITQSQ